MIVGFSVYASLSQGPTPSPPKASQSLAPTGCTPSSSAVSASPQPRATTRFGCEGISVVPSAVVMDTGKAPDEPDASPEAEPDGEPPLQPARTRDAATTAPAAASTRRTRRAEGEVRIT